VDACQDVAVPSLSPPYSIFMASGRFHGFAWPLSCR
jgi:hypothetical protein